MKYANIREEELKNKIAKDYFGDFDCTKIIGNIDFCACLHQESLFWAEAKKGLSDIYYSLVQLILTIGKARTFDQSLPPPMLGAFDSEKIAFIPYNEIHGIFYQNDFNWNVAPSDHSSKEFQQIYAKVKDTIDQETLLFNFEKDDKELKKFIKINFVVGNFGFTKTRIDKNNFIVIYNKWLQSVKPTIAVNWDIAKKSGIIDGDFYLADLLSRENNTLKEKLFVLLKYDHYELNRKVDASGLFSHSTATFNDKQIAHTQFWNRYERPPKKEYWDYIVERRDLLVPQDVRERKGSFFTPQVWVELSQKYLTDSLGEDWQDEYTIWDCAAGTGNLLNGLTNKYNIWASTLDMQDVEVMKDRIKNGANLLESHVFQFDFLNDDFSKLPKGLQDIINNPEKCKKLVVYINPPYAEHGNRATILDYGKHKASVANTTKIHSEFNKIVGTATRELFAQFFLRVYKEMPEATLASFGKLKYVNSQNFLKFRNYFQAEFCNGFICNANTFDNVKGKFPIGFLIWNLKNKKKIKKITTDIFELNSNKVENGIKKKSFYALGGRGFISRWLRGFYDKQSQGIGYVILPGIDMQQQNGVYFTSKPTSSDIFQHKIATITKNNLKEMAIYLAIRHCIEASWLNDRDQFLYPNEGWKNDTQFQNDCLTFSLFHSQNRISSLDGVNHWIPFSEQEVNARDKFSSDFMTQFIKGKLKHEVQTIFIDESAQRTTPLIFSQEAQTVFTAGKNLWKYYHTQTPDFVYNVNSSFYDIRAHFQGRNSQGKMNNKSDDAVYMALIDALREAQKNLQKIITPKIYAYGFLKD